MTETGRMGILSDQGWKKRRMTVKFMDEERGYMEKTQITTMDITMAWEEDWKNAKIVLPIQDGFQQFAVDSNTHEHL